jgi:mannose-1-phosphate guanylyltransferase/mannose-1-phosphate guanylyltransferase/mannose-6-phosphate isomerase
MTDVVLSGLVPRKTSRAVPRRSPDEQRPWGRFYVLDEGADFKVKRIMVKPQGRLSLQSHSHRAEHWVVVAGEATVTVGESVQTMTRGQSIDIYLGAVHRLENFGTEDVALIEVQFGNYMGEDDIVRYEDAYQRA